MNYVKKTVAELLSIDTKQEVVEFIKELSLHAEEGKMIVSDAKLNALVEKYYKNQRVSYTGDMGDDVMKVMSWIDCLEFLQKHFDGKTNAYDVKLCFEYHTPDGEWMDVVVLDDKRITILEFKSGANDDSKKLLEYEEQLDRYRSKMSHANVNVWQRFEDGLKVQGFLVYTNEKMKDDEKNKEFVIVCDEFEKIANDFKGSMDDSTELEVMKFEEGFDSSTLSAFIRVLKGEILDNIYIPDKCKDRCVEIIDDGLESQEPRVNIVFVNGKPGAGKTGVALALVSEYLQRNKENGKNITIKYATGNGNLFSLFSKAAETERTQGCTGFVFSRIRYLYKINDIVSNPAGFMEYDPKTKENIIVIDEAQRMWSSERIAFSVKKKEEEDEWVSIYDDEGKKVILQNNLSEPVMVLRDVYKAARDASSEKTIIFLIGNGQEIYTGEELGEEQIIQAVKSVSDMFCGIVDTKIFSSKKYENLADEIQDNSDDNIELYLRTEKRNRMSQNAGSMIDDLFNNKNVPDSGKTPFIVVGSEEEMVARYKAISKSNSKAKQRLFISSYDQKNFIEKKKKIAIKSGRGDKDDQLYDFFMKDLGSNLECFATEFNAQGLEIDYAYFIWGNRIKRENEKWKITTNNVGTIYYYYRGIEEFKEKNQDILIGSHNINKEIEKMIINAYRVLLTRAQEKTIICVEDKQTREYLQRMLCGDTD